MNAKTIVNKKILYIGPTFFHYDKSVVSKIKALGALIDSFDLYPNSFYLKSIKKLKLTNHIEEYKTNYYNKALLNGNYDYILIRHGFQLKIEFLEKLRKANPSARLINFHWDAISARYNYSHMIKFYDKVCSFDYKDCQNHNLSYLPLFYLDEYADYKSKLSNKEKKIDILFIGTWRKDRYDVVKMTEKNCKENNVNFFYYLNAPFRAQFSSLRKGVFPKAAKNKYLSHNEILSYFSSSSNILDLPGDFQTGLTIRTFETLAAGKKLITTNKNIIAEPFYNPEYISVLDSKNIELDIDFIKHKPLSSIDEAIENYSLENYIYKLLS